MAASSSIRSTVSPAVRHGASEKLRQDIGRLRARPRDRRVTQSSGSKALQPQHPRNRPLQALVAALALPARHARQRHRQIRQQPPFRRDAENMQAVADLHFLEVAEIGIELFERLRPRRP